MYVKRSKERLAIKHFDLAVYEKLIKIDEKLIIMMEKMDKIEKLRY